MILLSIGSNLGNKYDNIKRCISLISKFSQVKKKSFFYRSPSYPNKNYPKFINLVIQIEYKGDPNSLLKRLKLVEKRIGRLKKIKNAPRVCDIDIIDYNGFIIENETLSIPHSNMHKRNFVLYPLKDIAPNWLHPKLNKNVEFLKNELNRVSHIEITRIKESDINK